jgi:hypothetical protein
MLIILVLSLRRLARDDNRPLFASADQKLQQHRPKDKYKIRTPSLFLMPINLCAQKYI